MNLSQLSQIQIEKTIKVGRFLNLPTFDWNIHPEHVVSAWRSALEALLRKLDELEGSNGQ